MGTRGVEAPLVSNRACSYSPRSANAFYAGIIHFVGHEGGLYAPDRVHLGRQLPQDLSPLNILNWVHERREPKRYLTKGVSIDPRQIVALSILRVCEQRQHQHGPNTPYLYARSEVFGSWLFARRNGEAVDVVPPQPQAIPDRDQMPLARMDARQISVNTIILPQAYGQPDTEAIRKAVQLGGPASGRYFGGLTSHVQLVGYDTMWAGAPEHPVSPPSPADKPPF